MKARDLIQIIKTSLNSQVIINRGFNDYVIMGNIIPAKKFYCESFNHHKTFITTVNGNKRYAVDYEVGKIFTGENLQKYKVVNVFVI